MEKTMKLDNKEAKAMALEMAKQSLCKKRQVGACITDPHGLIIGQGFNHNPTDEECEDCDGNTLSDVVHAEVAAIKNMHSINSAAIIYVTHEPCENCTRAIMEAGIIHIVIVEDFMKFDTGKLRYDLIPVSSTKALAEVLTYGAKKYKPNNWQKVDDSERYIAAAFRHFEALRGGEEFDPESGLRHSAHLMTNFAFLNYFETLK